jgi:hypothetical protein
MLSPRDGNKFVATTGAGRERAHPLISPQRQRLLPDGRDLDSLVLDAATLADFGQMVAVCSRFRTQGDLDKLKAAFARLTQASLWRMWISAEIGINPVAELVDCVPAERYDEAIHRESPTGKSLLQQIVELDQATWLEALMKIVPPAMVLGHINDEEESLFWAACSTGKTRLVRMLLRGKYVAPAEINACPFYPGESHLYMAVYHKHSEVVRVLLEYPVELRKRTSEGFHILEMLQMRSNLPVQLVFHGYAYWRRARIILFAHLREASSVFFRLPKVAIKRLLSFLRTKPPAPPPL